MFMRSPPAAAKRPLGAAHNGRMPRRLAFFLLALAFSTSTFAFDLQGHRGTRGWRPENTLPAFAHALTLGVDTLETDIGVTADGVAVLSHDPYLNPLITRDAQGRWLAGPRGPLIRSLTLAQLQVYDVGRLQPGTPYAKTFETQQPADGTRVPTLAQLFDQVKARGASQLRFNIETKINPAQPDDTVGPEAMVQALLGAVREAGMGSRVTIQSFDWRTLKLVQKLEPSIPTVCLTVQAPGNDNTRDGSWTAGLKFEEHGSAPKVAKAAGCAAWSPNQGALTEELVKQAQSLGLKVVPWTVNDPAVIDRFVGWGVDGIISDYPDRVREVMARRGMPLPAAVKP